MSQITDNLAAYIADKKIKLSELSRMAGVPYYGLYHSVADKGRKKDLKDWELLAVCKVLDIDPRELDR